VYTTPDQTLGVMSVGFLLANKDDPVVWRGPKKTGLTMIVFFKKIIKIFNYFNMKR
jgi:hypothetical protein